MRKRTKKLDISNLSKSEADRLGEEIGKRLRKVMDNACDEANRIVKGYGISVKMGFVIEKSTDKDSKENTNV